MGKATKYTHSTNKAVIYARYSSEKQSEMSIDGQVREVRAFAEQQGYTIIGEYIDRALTGKIDKRPDFQRMIKDSGKGLFEYVIVYQLDRFARNRYDSAHYKHQLKKNGVKVLSAKENIADDPSGILMETVLEGMAEYYSAELAQKVKRGMYESFLLGRNLGGGRCYGYDTEPFGHSSSGRVSTRLVINNAEAEIVRKVFDDYASGKMAKDIKKWLDTNGIIGRKGKPFHVNGVLHMLGNDKYIGTATFGNEKKENLVPAIVDKDIFERVQQRLNRNKKSPLSFKAREHYLLSTKIYCGYCKNIITAESGTSRHGTTHRYYKCYTKKRHLSICEQNQVVKEKLENKVVFATIELLKRKGMIERIAHKLVEYNDKLQANPQLELYEQQLKETIRNIDNLMNAVTQGFYNTTMQDKMLKLESEKADLQFRIDGERLNVPAKLDYDKVVDYLELFANGDPTNAQFRENLVDTFVNKIIMWNNEMIITYNILGKDGKKVTVQEIIDDFNANKVKNPTIMGFDTSLCGARERTRTFNNWFLRPARMPIPPPERFVIVSYAGVGCNKFN